eukprot:gene14003-15461_t
MVDTGDFFRKLGSGATFNSRILENQELSKQTDHLLSQRRAEALDFFGSKSDSQEDIKEANTTTVKEEEKSSKRTKNKEKRPLSVDVVSDMSSNSPKSKRTKFGPEKMAALREEKINCLRNEHQIHIQGHDIPEPMIGFSDLEQRFKCPPYLVKNIEEAGYSQPTPVQMQAIPLLLNHRDSLVCAQTGSGKTLAFIIPILMHLKKPKRSGLRALVVAPTRELANQIYREFSQMNVGRGFRISVLTKSRASSISSSKQFHLHLDILITTPNRLVHLIQEETRGMELNKVEWLVLDEGDKLFEEGTNGFREQISSILKACDNSKITRTLFSATLGNQVEEWCSLHLNNFVRVTIGARNSATENVKQELLFTGQESGKLIAIRDILRKSFEPPILVFVQSKDKAKELFNELIYDGMNVDVIHADRTQAQRDNIVKNFRIGKIWVLIATELMGRGIDFKGVNLVINYDFPPSAISYIHRIGRTGRAGRQGTAVTFFTEDDIESLRSIANVMQLSGSQIPEWILQVPKKTRSGKRKSKSKNNEKPSMNGKSKTMSKIIKKKKS